MLLKLSTQTLRVLAVFALTVTVFGQELESNWPKGEIAKGLSLGKQFSTRKQFLETGLRQNRFQIQSAWAKDGISKYVTFYRDYHVVAARVAEAKQRLQEVSEKDLASIPYTGLLFANIDLHARGAFPMRHLGQRFAGGGTHMVLQIDGVNIQPAKEGFFPHPEKKTCVGQYYTYSVFAFRNFGVGFGDVNEVAWDCSQQLDRFSLEFGFLLSSDQEQKRALAIVVDLEGNQHSVPVDLASLR